MLAGLAVWCLLAAGEDIRDIVGDLLTEAPEVEAWIGLREYVADQDATEYGWVSLKSLWATLNDLHEGDWRKFMEYSRAHEPEDAKELGTRLKPEVGALFVKITKITRMQGLLRLGST